MTRILFVALLCASAVFAQDSTRRFIFGGRVEAYPLSLFDTKTTTVSTTSPVADLTYTGSSDSSHLGFGPTFEYRFTKKLSLGVEMFYHQAQYKQQVDTRFGTKDPNAATDDRKPYTVVETTRASYWEIPIIARYYGIRQRGVLSHGYVIGGAVIRQTSNIRTGNEITNPDQTTNYNEIQAKAKNATQIGGVVGLGMRFIDPVGLRIMPEVRYTLWQGYTFQGPSFNSVPRQLEVGLGFSF